MIQNALRGEGLISVTGKEYSVKLNMNAFRLLTQIFGVQLEALDTYMQENQLDALCALAYCGIKAGEAKKGNKFDMDYDFFCAEFLDNEEGMLAVTEIISGATTGAEEGDSGNE